MVIEKGTLSETTKNGFGSRQCRGESLPTVVSVTPNSLHKHGSSDPQVRNAYYDDIILEDLNTTSTQDRIILETRDRATMVSASTTIVEEGEEEPVLDEAEMVEIIFDTKSEFNIWSPSLGSVGFSRSIITVHQ